jgi:hypothetical protein
VRSDFDWRPYLEAKQVQGVVNYVATADWVVAIFPRLFQMLGFRDLLGGAGHDGFSNEPPDAVTDVEYVRGRHSAAVGEHQWQEIAAFVIDSTRPPHKRDPIRNFVVMAAAYAAPVIWVGLAMLAAIPFYVSVTALAAPAPTGVPAWLAAGMLIGWFQLLRLVLTRL